MTTDGSMTNPQDYLWLVQMRQMILDTMSICLTHHLETGEQSHYDFAMEFGAVSKQLKVRIDAAKRGL